MTINDNDWTEIKESMNMANTLSKISDVTSKVVKLSSMIAIDSNQQNAKLLDTATYVSTQLDLIANRVNDENIRSSILEYKNDMTETVRPIVIAYIDKALMLYRYMSNLIESGNASAVPMDVYNKASEMQETIKLLRNYWAA